LQNHAAKKTVYDGIVQWSNTSFVTRDWCIIHWLSRPALLRCIIYMHANLLRLLSWWTKKLLIPLMIRRKCKTNGPSVHNFRLRIQICAWNEITWIRWVCHLISILDQSPQNAFFPIRRHSVWESAPISWALAWSYELTQNHGSRQQKSPRRICFVPSSYTMSW
jgi:hypothetical protein